MTDIFKNGDKKENRETLDKRSQDFAKYDNPARDALNAMLAGLQEIGMTLVDFRPIVYAERTPDVAVVYKDKLDNYISKISKKLKRNINVNSLMVQEYIRDKANVVMVIELSVKTKWEDGEFPYSDSHVPPRKRHYFDYVSNPSDIKFVEFNKSYSKFVMLDGKDVYDTIKKAENGQGYEETTVESGNKELFINVPHSNAFFGKV